MAEIQLFYSLKIWSSDKLFVTLRINNQLIMNAYPLDQNLSVNSNIGDNTLTKVQKKRHFTIPEGSILERLFDFASSVTDFRRTDRGNIRHKLKDILLIEIMARISGCKRRADIIEFGWHNLTRFQSMGLLMNGVPSEPTLCRIEKSIDDKVMADRMKEMMKDLHSELLKPDSGLEIISVDGKAERGTIQANGRNPDIVSAYSFDTQMTLATEACEEKSNEIKAVPLLLDKIDVSGKVFTADAINLQKDIVDKIREKGGDFIIELKANQRSLRYVVEDRLAELSPSYTYTNGPEIGHGRIETRTYHVYDATSIIADKEKWGGEITIIKFVSESIKKSTDTCTCEERLYVSSLPADTPQLGEAVRKHWSIESMHWMLDYNLLQDKILRKHVRSARNLDTIQRIVYNVFSIWKGRRKKRVDKAKGMAKLMRHVSMSFTKLMRFLSQK